MTSRSVRTADPDVPAVREYGAVFLLLLASGIAQRLAVGAVEYVADRTPVLLDPRLVGSVVYTALALTALAAVSVAVRRLRPSVDPLERNELLAVGGTAAFFLGIAAYRLHAAADLPVFPGNLVTSLLRSGVAMGAIALGYARFRGIAVPLSLPDRDARPVLGATVLAAVLAGLTWIAAFVLTSPWLGAPAPTDAVSGAFVARQPSTGSLLLNVVVPGVVGGFGTALLYNGAVQGGLRSEAGPLGAVAAVTALAVTAVWSIGPVGWLTRNAGSIATAAGTATLSLLAAAVAAGLTDRLPGLLDREASAAEAASVGALVAGAPPLVLFAVTSYPPVAVVQVAATALVAAVAAVGYERTGSVWVAVAAFATYGAVTHREVALLLAPLVG